MVFQKNTAYNIIGVHESESKNKQDALVPKEVSFADLSQHEGLVGENIVVFIKQNFLMFSSFHLDVNFIHSIVICMFMFSALRGYIKTKFVSTASRYENSSYGCGSITDGTYKVSIQVSNFQDNDIKKGTAVKVVGEINNAGVFSKF